MASLLRWSDSARPGKAPKRPSRISDQVTEAKKKYEDKRVREFKTHWTDGRPWLKYDNENSVMYCTYCKEQGKGGKFVSGCTNFRIDTIQNHEVSSPHISATSVTERPLPQNSLSAKAINSIKQTEYDRLSILFRNAHAVAKHHLSFKTYNVICKLDQAKGLDVGNSYLNDKKACEFVKNIASVSRKETRDLLKKTPFLSLTCDGSSDFMGDEYESLWVRSAQNGKIIEKFLDLGTAESAGSQDIFNYMKAVCFENSEDNTNQLWSKLIGFCSDGASNMQGIRNGVAALMKRENPEIVVTHCLAHRVELSFKDAIKSSKLYDKTITLLLGLYYLYRRGPKQKKALKRAFSALNMKKILPTHVGGTRWMPHMLRAINVIIKGYRGFKAHLESASHENPKAEGLTKILTDVAVVTFMLNLKEIISPLNRLSLILQKQNLTLYNGHAQIKATTEVLKICKPKYGDHEIHLVKKNLKSTLIRSGMDIEEVNTEYSNRLIDGALTWGSVFETFRDGLDNIKLVIDALLSLPPTSVNNETIFSRTKLSKGKRRGHLKMDTLKDLIQVEIETANVEQFDPKLDDYPFRQKKESWLFQTITVNRDTPNKHSRPRNCCGWS
ncbi:zinc finger protein 862-like isoform X2 [Mytilus galloprovincialis]|uniref:zinc finger protein 862-like isoform X2 n=1 Tax=Mytilus galloprovincialis TaxID=29158 RepID=UPI003F7C0EDC